MAQHLDRPCLGCSAVAQLLNEGGLRYAAQRRPRCWP